MENISGLTHSLKPQIEAFLREDGLFFNDYYFSSLPHDKVDCSLNFKSDLTVAGLPYFFEVFQYLSHERIDYQKHLQWEGKNIQKDSHANLKFSLPFSVALTGERLALNLLQRASAVATYTKKFVEKAEKYKISILDTRKTTPGLRFLEKYAVRIGGGSNHRFAQTDLWMIKDNHKKFFGGLGPALKYFKSLGAFYMPVVVEIHNLQELEEAIHKKVQHVMLDNFSPEQVKSAIKIKPKFMSFEISGGIRLDNLDDYLIEGIDALSIGGLTFNPSPVDISLKFSKNLG